MIDKRWDNFMDLIDAYLEGELSQQEAERLAVWLSIDDEAQAIYLRALKLHADLTLTFSEANNLFSGGTEAVNCQSVVSDEVCTSKTITSATTRAHTLVRRRQSHNSRRAWQRAARYAYKSFVVYGVIMLAAVAAWGSERLISEFRLVTRTKADHSGGMLFAAPDEGKQRLYSGANVERGTRRVGSGRDQGVALASVFLFPLPALAELEHIDSTRIEWTYKARDGDPVFSVDLYGLGFVRQLGSLEQLNFWEGPLDTSYRSEYRMDGDSDRRVALIKRGAMTPQTPCGRVVIENRNLTRFLRSLYEDGAQEGDFVVFRLNADEPTSQIARETGYTVVHPPAQPALTHPDEQPGLVITLASRHRSREPVRAQAAMVAHSISASAHWSGGLVRSFNSRVQSGGNVDGTRRVGSSSFDGVGLANVFVFSLPSLEEIDKVVAARLQWTLVSKDNAPEFSVDLYGLGFTRDSSYHGPCFWEGPQDNSGPVDYVLHGDTVHLIARRAMYPGTACGPVVVENRELLEFLRSLYDAGAREGDLVVFRLNADITTTSISRSTGYAVVHAIDGANQTSPADLPVMLVTFTETSRLSEAHPAECCTCDATYLCLCKFKALRKWLQ